jgi:hypothetical protein
MFKTIFPAIIFLFTLSCTNLFSTRADKVEKPDPGSVSQVFEDPSDPVKIMTNLSRAIEGANTVEYGKLFSNPDIVSERHFRFVGDANQISQLFSPWTYTEEQIFFSKLVKSDENIKPSFRFTFIDSLPAQVFTALDSVETDFMEYELKVILADSETVYVGFANFKLFKSATANDAWYIYYWEDRAKNEAIDQSWSALKVANQ